MTAQTQTPKTIIRVPQLGLAAYLSMKGQQLVKYEDKSFFFESDRTLNEWRSEYTNSESMRHDTRVCELRHFMKA